MKKTLISIVLASFLLSMPVSSEGRSMNPSGDEIQTVSTPVSSSAPAFLQSIGIGVRRRTRRRRRVHRRVVRHRVVHRRVVRHRRNRGRRIGVRLPIPRGIGVGVRRRRRNY